MKPITYSRRQVALMCQFAAIYDSQFKPDFESPTVPPAVLRRFNLKQRGDVYVWNPAQ